ncbi:MAG: glycoside hydrolase family 78 protein, partial [Bacteroides sp.]|nr:glycoside hydrolase family 78 protein [Bacteroides sp.]
MNKTKAIACCALFITILLPLKAIEVTRLTCEMVEEPLVLATATPRFGWQMEAKENGVSQSAYTIEVYTGENGFSRLVWESGKISSSQSQLIPYQGEKLLPVRRYTWRVKVWDEKDRPSAWSRESQFRIAPDAAFLDADWIGAIAHEEANLPEGRHFQGSVLKEPEVKEKWEAVDSLSRKSIYLRKGFQAEKQIREAVAYVCGLGHYEFSLNGKKVGDSEFAPLWSDYEKTVYYNTYDITSYLKKGENVAGILLGNGFYNVQGGRYVKLKISFGAPTLFFKMIVTYNDGSTEVVCSGNDWKYDLSPITFNCIYGGEEYDARLEQKGWDKPGFKDTNWKPVVVQTAPKGVLSPQQAPPVKIMEYYDIQKIHKLTPEEVEAATLSTKRTVDPSAIVLDMGQNLAGFPQITVKGKKGQQVTLLVAESLTDEGAANQRQTGRQHYYVYTLKGDGTETWHPRFSYYGFRYIQVEGAVLKGEKNPQDLPVIQDLKSCFIYNSAPKISTFESSNPIFNAAHRLIEKAVRSNMQSVFTDCPHREKLGWLEQVHLNGSGLFYNYDLTTYAPKVMQDMADTQQSDGFLPTTAPRYVVFEGPGMDDFADSPEWGSSIVILPFIYYENYGDNSLIVNYYRNMRGYVDYLTSRADNHIVSHGLGDWYDYGDFKAGFSKNTPVPLVATAHYYLDICYMIEATRMVGNAWDEAYYTRLAKEVKEAFNEKFFNPATRQYGTASQASNALPLFLELVDPQYREDVLGNLVKDIQEHGNRLTTGDVGNRYLFQTLARNGLNELMYTMHNHEETPGYGFQLKFGATTLTEQWDPRQGSSWNHFMMGQIDEWFFASLAGIQFDEKNPGYQHFVIRPEPVGDLIYIKATHESLYGTIKVDWQRKNGIFTLHV